MEEKKKGFYSLENFGCMKDCEICPFTEECKDFGKYYENKTKIFREIKKRKPELGGKFAFAKTGKNSLWIYEENGKYICGGDWESDEFVKGLPINIDWIGNIPEPVFRKEFKDWQERTFITCDSYNADYPTYWGWWYTYDYTYCDEEAKNDEGKNLE